MRTIIPVYGGGDGGESRGLRSRVGRMKKLLWLKPNPCEDVHMDTEDGVWLTSFQTLDTDGQYEVSRSKVSMIVNKGYVPLLQFTVAAAVGDLKPFQTLT